MTPTAAQMDGVVKKIQAMCAGRSDGHPQKRTPTLLTDAPSHSMMRYTLFGRRIQANPGASRRCGRGL